jgi:hypothetical protein
MSHKNKCKIGIKQLTHLVRDECVDAGVLDLHLRQEGRTPGTAANRFVLWDIHT